MSGYKQVGTKAKRGLSGLAQMSAIRGTVGATPRTNKGTSTSADKQARRGVMSMNEGMNKHDQRHSRCDTKNK